MAGDVASVVLAAGLGTRMKSKRPKVLHSLGGRPLIAWAVDAARRSSDLPVCVVVGPEAADDVRSLLGDSVRLVIQAERLGTGHAVLQAAGALKGRAELVLVTSADMPLLQADTLASVVAEQRKRPGPMTLLSVVTDTPRGFGRLLRDARGEIRAIVEEAHASAEQRRIREVNAGVYCFRGDWLWESLPRLSVSPKGEYYLTDLVELAVAQGERVASHVTEDLEEVIGVNTREHLAEAEAALRRRTNRQWMLAGVSFVDPATTYVGPEVTLAADTVLLPNTHLEGKTTVGARCRLGPNTIVRDSVIGEDCAVEASVLEGAWLEAEVEVGPFAHLRPGARLMRGVHMGNFGEVKSSTLGPGTKMGHFSYVGDAEVGPEVNIGAGTVTCNFDGEKKNKTVIDEGAFIGSDTMLVAPLRVGRAARTGAGAVVTKDVPAGTLAVGMPARAIRRQKPRDSS